MKGRNFIAYDFAYVYGGAERVMADLCEALETSQLHVSFSASDIKAQFDAQGIEVCNIKSPSVNWLPFAHAIRAIIGFSRLRTTTQFQNALVSGFYAPLCLPELQANKRIYYCHTPPRFLFDLREFYQQELGMMSPVLNVLDALYLPRYRRALQHTDVILANSKNVQARLSRYLGVTSEVVNPCIDVANYNNAGDQGFYLSLARHENYKRLDVIIDAFASMPDKQLIIASGGAQTAQLKARAQGYDNIRFTGWLNTADLRKLISECTATLYLPRDEDFGLSPIESMASGKPVIGVDEGGIKETVTHEQTGYLCPATPTAEHVINAVAWLTPSRAASLRRACEVRAAEFDRPHFIARIKDYTTDKL